MITEVEEESQSNQSKVTDIMASLRQIIDEQEKVLLENIRAVERDQKKSVEEYKRLLQGEQQSFIEQVLDFVVVCKDKQSKKQLEAKLQFEDYIKRTDLKLLELKPLTRTANHVTGLEKIKEIETQIRNIRVEKVPKYVNQELQQRIANNPDKSTLNLANSKLTDLDMEIVADELEINEVREHCFLLPFRLLQCNKRKVFQRATSIVYQVFFFFLRKQHQIILRSTEILNTKSELCRIDLLQMLESTVSLKQFFSIKIEN
jgi:hypothetical protein